MKYFKIISLVTMIMLVCTALFMLSPMSVFADQTIKEYETEIYESGSFEEIYDTVVKEEYYQIANIHSDGVTISTNDENLEGTVYSFKVATTGYAYSSFKLTISMPSFVDVTEVIQSDDLLNVSENGVFESDISDNTVTVSFSSPTNFSDMVLFSVNFTVNDYSEQSSAVEYYDYQFVNEDVELVGAEFDLGCISITQNIMMGDVNADLTVNLADLLIIQRSIVNERFSLSEIQYRAADIDKNGTVDMLDCQYIQNFLVGRIGSLEDINGGDVTEPGEDSGADSDVDYDLELAQLIDEAIDEANKEWDELFDKGISMSTIKVYERQYQSIIEHMKKSDSIEALEEYKYMFYDMINNIMKTASGDVTEPGEDSGVDSGEDSGEGYDSELTQLIDEAIEYANQEWDGLFDKGISMSTIAVYEKQYQTIIESMKNSDSIEVLEANMQKFDDMINKIMKTVEGDVTEPEACAHESVYSDGIGATCTENGLIREICNDCGEILSEHYMAALGHSYGEDGACMICGKSEENMMPEEKELLYTYASEEKMLYLYSDYSSEYVERVYTADGSVITTKGMSKWYESDGRIYAFTDTTEDVFTATDSGELVLCEKAFNSENGSDELVDGGDNTENGWSPIIKPTEDSSSEDGEIILA